MNWTIFITNNLVPALSRNHFVHPHIVGFGVSVGDDLTRETDTDLAGIRPRSGEHSVVKPLAASESAALEIEGKAGAEKHIHILDGDLRQSGGRFKDAESAGNQLGSRIFHQMKYQITADHARKDPPAAGMAGD